MPNDAPQQGSPDGANASDAGSVHSAETLDTDTDGLPAPETPDEEPAGHTLAAIANRDTNGWNQWPKALRIAGSLGAVVAAVILTSMAADGLSTEPWFRSAGESATGATTTPAQSGTTPTGTPTASPPPSASPSPTVSASGSAATSPPPDGSAPSRTPESEQPDQQTGPDDDAGPRPPDDPADDTPEGGTAPAAYSMLWDEEDGELQGVCEWAAGDMDLGDRDLAEAGGRFELAYRTCPEMGSYVATSRPASVLGNRTSRPEPQDCEEAAHGGEPLDLRVDGGGLPVGSTFCTTTDKGRIAYVVITGYTRNFSMTFDLTTWEIAD